MGAPTMTALRICIIASTRFPIREPFAGGLEAHTHTLARQLSARGHQVSLFAAPGSDPLLGAVDLPVRQFTSTERARADTAAPPEQWMSEHHAYLGLMLDLAADTAGRFDVVHNNSLHHLPVAMAASLPIPVITTLHTPPLPWLESAFGFRAQNLAVTAVSRFVARAWSGSVQATVVPNGVDTELWVPGRGGGDAVWSGRLVPEKAPHLAMDAAQRAGVDLKLVGPMHDLGYFRAEIEPRLNDRVTYLGHLGSRALRKVIGAASVAVVSPAWDEPYGLVAAEALACGTPVATFARGGLTEVVNETVGALAEPDDVDALAAAIRRAAGRDRNTVRRYAEQHCSAAVMIRGYERLYRVLAQPLAS